MPEYICVVPFYCGCNKQPDADVWRIMETSREAAKIAAKFETRKNRTARDGYVLGEVSVSSAGELAGSILLPFANHPSL